MKHYLFYCTGQQKRYEHITGILLDGMDRLKVRKKNKLQLNYSNAVFLYYDYDTCMSK